MTGPESEQLGRLAGILEGLLTQFKTEHDETKAALENIRDEMSHLRESTASAAMVAREFSDFKKNEHVPLRDHVDGLIKWRIYLTGALAATLLYVTFGLKAWDIFH